jgi:hypothetical protein
MSPAACWSWKAFLRRVHSSSFCAHVAASFARSRGPLARSCSMSASMPALISSGFLRRLETNDHMTASTFSALKDFWKLEHGCL